MIYVGFIDSPIGSIGLASTEKGLCLLHMDTSKEAFISNIITEIKDRDIEVADNEHISVVKTQLTEYFDGKLKYFNISLDLNGTEFQKRVWNQLMKIPYGELRSYGDIAQALGDKRYSRAVGTANRKNPIPIIVPCHRVIREGRRISNYSGGLHVQRYLFEVEGIAHKDIQYI